MHIIHISKPYLCINSNIHIHSIQLQYMQFFQKKTHPLNHMHVVFCKKISTSISESKRMLRCHECRFKALRSVLKLMTSTGCFFCKMGRMTWTAKLIGSSESLGIQSPCQMMIGVYNHLLSKVFRCHYHSQKVIGSLGSTLIQPPKSASYT